MKTREEKLRRMSEEMDKYNETALKYNYNTLWFDIRKQVVKGGCMPKKELVDKNCFGGIVNIIRDIYLSWRYKRIMKLSREVWSTKQKWYR